MEEIYKVVLPVLISITSYFLWRTMNTLDKVVERQNSMEVSHAVLKERVDYIEKKV